MYRGSQCQSGVNTQQQQNEGGNALFPVVDAPCPVSPACSAQGSPSLPAAPVSAHPSPNSTRPLAGVSAAEQEPPGSAARCEGVSGARSAGREWGPASQQRPCCRCRAASFWNQQSVRTEQVRADKHRVRPARSWQEPNHPLQQPDGATQRLNSPLWSSRTAYPPESQLRGSVLQHQRVELRPQLLKVLLQPCTPARRGPQLLLMQLLPFLPDLLGAGPAGRRQVLHAGLKVFDHSLLLENLDPENKREEQRGETPGRRQVGRIRPPREGGGGRRDHPGDPGAATAG